MNFLVNIAIYQIIANYQQILMEDSLLYIQHFFHIFLVNIYIYYHLNLLNKLLIYFLIKN